MFTDYTKIIIKSGNGGNGAATVRREKYVAAGGPDGGDGGNGGNIYFQVDKDKNTLIVSDKMGENYFSALLCFLRPCRSQLTAAVLLK